MPRSALWIQEGYAFPSTRQAEILRIPICWWLNLSRTRGTFSSWMAAASCRYLQNCVKNSKKGKKLGRIYLKKSLFPQRCGRFSSCPTYLVSCTFLYIPACNRCCHALGSLFFANGRILNRWIIFERFFVLFQILNMKEKLAWSGLKVIYTGSSKIVKEVKIRYLSTSNSNIDRSYQSCRSIRFIFLDAELARCRNSRTWSRTNGTESWCQRFSSEQETDSFPSKAAARITRSDTWTGNNWPNTWRKSARY